MSGYKSYTHVERLDSPECEGLLENDYVVVTCKVDGTNACVYWDADLEKVGAGSRTRPLTLEKDNADFYAWIRSSQEEAVSLRRFITDNPQYIVYGEWLGSSKFIGSIKTYDSFALGHMYIFDVFDTVKMEYLGEKRWRDLLTSYSLDPWFVEVLGVLSHPTYETIVELAETNKFLLTNAENKGEGVVCKAQGWRNKYGRQVYGKIVLAEFHEHKSKAKHRPDSQAENIEKDIVDYFVTDSELAKAKEKTAIYFGEDFRIEGKFMGYYLNCVFNDILDEMSFILKKYKMPTINFRVLKAEAQNKARAYLGL